MPARDLEEMTEELKAAVREELDLTAEPGDAGVYACIDRLMRREARLNTLPIRQKRRLRKRVFDAFRRLDILQELLEDPAVTEIMVNGTQAIYFEKEGRLQKWDRRFTSAALLEDLIQRIVSGVNRSVNTASPIVDARLPDGSRVNVVLPPAAPDGPILTIRRFPAEAMTLRRLTALGSITEEAAAFLAARVQNGCNLFVSGGTGSGKTTFLNALSFCIPQEERVVTVEDSLELMLSIENLVRLEVRDENLQGRGGIGIRDLIRTALRMRPDRLIVGEVRGPEALDMLQAMNTGHDGSLCTGHGNSPRDMLARIETMVLMGGELPLAAVRSQIASALDLMVHLERRRDGSRRVTEISEVLGLENGEILLETLYAADADGVLRQRANYRGDKRRRDAGGAPAGRAGSAARG